jgi:hypothetical protein
MRLRWLRLIPVMLLTALAYDVIDADCTKGCWPGTPACASVADAWEVEVGPTSGCACCMLSEPAPGTSQVPAVDTQVPSPVMAPGGTCTGVRPVPYRPPLSLG